MYGLVELRPWQYVGLSVLMVHGTVLGVSLYLHRSMAHRAVDFHPVIGHLFRMWIWLTLGVKTREWVAVHRKHHAKVDTVDDPHSPVVLGLRRVLLRGTALYRAGARDETSVARYGTGTPDDWMERRLYTPHASLGVRVFALACVIAFGLPGLILAAVQLSSMPILASGIINGLGHAVGYRNFDSRDSSRNIVPWGVVIGGEELHNNHHASPGSAQFSHRPWELDLGWIYIRLLAAVGLAKVRKKTRAT